MADKKISQLTAATTPLDGTEVLPIVQTGTTVKVANNDLRPKQIQSNATSGVVQFVGPAAAATRVMTVPDANATLLYSGGALGTPSSGTLTNCTFPTLNQDTTGSAGSLKSTATTGLLTITGPGASTTRVMTVPNDSFTAARTDAAQTFVGDQTLNYGNWVQGTAAKGVNFSANTPAAGKTSTLLNWYEEGDWTPTLTATSGTITVSENAGYYTRVGRLVTFNCLLNIASVSSPTGVLTLNGLPFTSRNTNATYAACSVFAYALIAGTSTQIMASVNRNATTIAIYGFAGSTGTYVNLASAVQAGGQFQIAGSYVV